MRSDLIIKCCCVLIVVINFATSARILGIFHINSYSHFIMSDRILQELAARGHEVTAITPFEQKVPVKNMRHILLPDQDTRLNASNTNMVIRAEMDFITAGKRLSDVSLSYTETVLNNSKVQKLLRSNETFDLVIYEKFANEAFSGFAYHYNAPCVIFSGLRPSRWTSPQMGNPINPSYIPDFFSAYSTDMNFIERLHNSLIYVTCELFDHFWRIPKQNELLQKYFPGTPHVLDLYYNVSLALVNSHVSVNPAVPIVPNVIEIGGFHVQPPKELPKDLQEYLDGAKDGVVFFSMGSIVKSIDLPVEKRDELLGVFGRLKQKVLWKWEDDEFPGLPTNVKLGKWLPQRDILAHPNVRLFITHGGLLGIIESIYHGVPILGIPIYGDQDVNVKQAEHEGYGLGISYTKLTSEGLASKLTELLSNPKYSEAAKRKKQIMLDQPTQPLDRAIYWIEYVIRHKGAPHLRTAALNLHWYQYLLLDVAAAIFVVLVVISLIFRKCVTLCCKKSKSTVNKKIKTN